MRGLWYEPGHLKFVTCITDRILVLCQRGLPLCHERVAAAELVHGSLPTCANCTKSLRDSLGLTALVMSEGMRWCAALDRARETVRLPHVSIDVWHGEGYALLVVGACEYNPHIA